MGCTSCKGNNNSIQISGNKSNLLINLIIFLFSLIILICVTPIIFLGGCYLLFNSMVLNKDTNLIPSLTFISKLIYKNKDYSDENIDDFNEEDYELLNVEEVGKNG